MTQGIQQKSQQDKTKILWELRRKITSVSRGWNDLAQTALGFLWEISWEVCVKVIPLCTSKCNS